MALTVASGAVLVMGVGLRTLVDDGFRGGDAALLDQALIALFGIIVLLTAAATIGAFIYNLTTDLVGGVEVTLADRD